LPISVIAIAIGDDRFTSKPVKLIGFWPSSTRDETVAVPYSLRTFTFSFVRPRRDLMLGSLRNPSSTHRS